MGASGGKRPRLGCRRHGPTQPRWSTERCCNSLQLPHTGAFAGKLGRAGSSRPGSSLIGTCFAPDYNSSSRPGPHAAGAWWTSCSTAESGRNTAVKTASGAKLNFARLFVLVLFLALALAFWNSPVLLPLKLLVVMMHETGHALATLLVGGSVQRVVIALNQSGACLSQLPPGWGAKVLVYSAGYLGSALAGGALMLATFRFRASRAVLAALCLWLLVMAAFYAGDAFTLGFCVATALALGLGAKLLPASAVDLVNLFLAAFSSLYVLFDLREGLWNPVARAHSDAALLASLTFIPQLVWAAVWTLLAILLLGLFAWRSVRVAKEQGFSMRRSLGTIP